MNNNKKQSKMKRSIMTVTAALFVSSIMFAQLRPTDQTGINVFETPKTDTQFTGPKVEFGGAISMPYIALKQSNAVVNTDPGVNSQALFKNTPNFALSMANLYINSYLADGGDNFSVLKAGVDRTGGPIDVEAFNDYFAVFSPVAPGPMSRIVMVK